MAEVKVKHVADMVKVKDVSNADLKKGHRSLEKMPADKIVGGNGKEPKILDCDND